LPAVRRRAGAGERGGGAEKSHALIRFARVQNAKLDKQVME
jgi:hypothetical protein